MPAISKTKKLPVINPRQEISSNQYKERNCQQSIQDRKFPAINIRQEIASNQYKARNCKLSIQEKKLPAINTRKEIHCNQIKKRDCQHSIQGKKMPAVNKCLSLLFLFSPSIRTELVLSSHWNTFNHHFKRVLR